MTALIETFGIAPIIIILLVVIPAIVNFIGWCKNIYAKREQFKEANVQKGRTLEANEEKEEARFSSGEHRISELESSIKKLTEIVGKQAKQIDLLIKSDELDIKSWIKAQHEKWIPLGCIDSQSLDLLEQRFAVYEEEGGNSWAKKLVDELRALPTVTVVSIADIHESKK